MTRTLHTGQIDEAAARIPLMTDSIKLIPNEESKCLDTILRHLRGIVAALTELKEKSEKKF